jgi:NAD(P)-dependent dehydrogenase (short-subunit alcohol dehydrogenase family)
VYFDYKKNLRKEGAKQGVDMKLAEGKIVLVTGGARGIGRGVVEVFSAHGAHVVVLDTNEKEGREVAHAAQVVANRKSVAYHLDVSDPVIIPLVMDRIVEEFGRIDVLVNNAAVIRNHDILDFPLDEWREVFRVNVEGVFLCSQAAARKMIERNSPGVIINISSCAAQKADLRHSAYSASKAAVVSLTRSLALELGKFGIRVNAILPGATGSTDMLQNVFNNVPGIELELIKRTTLGKLATPQDQGNAALFLASDLASHITGEYLIVSGGEFMNA